MEVTRLDLAPPRAPLLQRRNGLLRVAPYMTSAQPICFPGSNKRLYDDEDGVSQELLDRGLVQKCAPGQWQLTVAGVQQLDQTLWLEPTGKVLTPRAVKVDDLSQLECQLELERRGWQMNNLEDNRQSAFAPFKGEARYGTFLYNVRTLLTEVG